MKPNRGFTLVEVLVALTLFAIVGGTLLQLFQSGLRSARLADAHSHAVFLARSKLTELQVYDNLQEGILSGTFRDGYRWQAALTPGSNAEGRAQSWLRPLDLVLTISWGDVGEEREFALETVLLTRRDAP